jgi:hypothetical protein
LPVFIADGQNAEESINASNFKPIWDVLNALKAHDDVLAAELDQIRTEMGRKSGTDVRANSLRKISIDLPITVDAGFGGALRTHLVEQVTESWNFWFGLLEAYVEREGQCRLLQTFKTVTGYALGSWVSTQRYKKIFLSHEQSKLLESLPGWTWNAVEEKWEEGFRQLNAFIEQYGHCRVAAKYKTTHGYRLGNWVGIQRLDRNCISADRKTRLEALPGWLWNVIDDLWEQGFKYLTEFLKREGHTRVFDNHITADGYKLGAWTGRQRLQKEKLTSERKARLAALPDWAWNVIDVQCATGDLKEPFSWLLGFVSSSAHPFSS